MRNLNFVRFFPNPRRHRSMWTFAIRAMIASSAAFCVAYFLKFDSPAWAPITVWTIAQPSRGMTISKSFYRFLGTCIGALIAIPLILYVSKTPWLFVACLALWMGLCSMVANVVLYFRSYAAILAGFTASIVSLLVFSHPDQIYDVALARVGCIFIGIGTTAIFSVLLGGRRAKQELFLKIQNAIVEALEWISVLAKRAPGEESRRFERMLVTEISSIEELTDYASAESLQIRLRIRRLHNVIGSLISILFSARAFDSLLERRSGVADELKIELGEISALAHLVAVRVKETNLLPVESFDALKRTFSALSSRLKHDSVHQTLLAERADELINSLASITADFKSLKSEGLRTPNATHLSHHRDWKSARLAGIRSVVGVSIAGAIWLLSDWHLGPILVMIAAVNCGIFAARPDSTTALLTAMKASVFSFLAALCTYVVFLSPESSLPHVLLAQVPFLLVGGLLIANVNTALIGAVFSANYLVFLSPSIPMIFNFRRFVDLGLGFFGGAVISWLIYRFLIPARPQQAADALRDKIIKELEKITFARSTESERQWGTRMYHRISRLILMSSDAATGAAGMVDSAMAALYIGRGVLRLKNDLARAESPPELKVILQNALTTIGQVSANPALAAKRLQALSDETRAIHSQDAAAQMLTQRSAITFEEIAVALTAHEKFFDLQRAKGALAGAA